MFVEEKTYTDIFEVGYLVRRSILEIEDGHELFGTISRYNNSCTINVVGFVVMLCVLEWYIKYKLGTDDSSAGKN